MTDVLAYGKKRKEFGHKPEFGDTETKVIGFLPTQRTDDLGPNYQRKNPSFITIDNIPEMSEHYVNTERVTTVDRGMWHQEGGTTKIKSILFLNFKRVAKRHGSH